jgi:predicted enzyme related to lactoylglutathione lyase
MKSKILGLRTTIYKVNDIDNAKDWYAKAFETQPYFDEPFYVGFNIGGYELGLQPEEEPIVKSDAVVSYWGVDNIVQEFERFIQLGATSHEKPQNVGGDIVVATIKDPWDNVIGLIYNPEFTLNL